MTSQMGFMLLCVSVEYFVLVDAEIVLLNIVSSLLRDYGQHLFVL